MTEKDSVRLQHHFMLNDPKYRLAMQMLARASKSGLEPHIVRNIARTQLNIAITRARRSSERVNHR